MKIKWLGHCCFLLTSDNGIRIITDPYENQMSLRWDDLDEEADIVTVSHEHFDHNNIKAIKGNPCVVRETNIVKGIEFRQIPTLHGANMGANRVFCFKVDGINICHLGDLGHPLTSEQTKQIDKVDLLLIPVGGYFTIDAKVATQVCDDLNPKIVIPMHYKTPKLDFPISGAEDFLKGKQNVRRLDSCETEFNSEKLPSTVEFVVLTPAY